MTTRAAQILEQESTRLSREWRTESAEHYLRGTLNALIRDARKVDEILRMAERQMKEGR